MTITMYTCPYPECEDVFDDSRKAKRHLQICPLKTTRKVFILKEMAAAAEAEAKAKAKADEAEEDEAEEVITGETDSSSSSDDDDDDDYVVCNRKIGKEARKNTLKKIKEDERKKKKKPKVLDYSNYPEPAPSSSSVAPPALAFEGLLF